MLRLLRVLQLRRDGSSSFIELEHVPIPPFFREVWALVLAVHSSLLALVAGILELPLLVVPALQVAVVGAFAIAVVARVEPLEVGIVLALLVAVLAAVIAAVLTGVDIRVVVAGEDAVRGAFVIAVLARVVIFILVLALGIEVADLLVRVLRVVRGEERMQKLKRFGISHLADELGQIAGDVAQAGAIVPGDMGMRMLGVGMFVQRLDPHVSVGGNLDFVASQRELIAVVLNRDGRGCCPKDALVLQHNTQELPGGLQLQKRSGLCACQRRPVTVRELGEKSDLFVQHRLFPLEIQDRVVGLLCLALLLGKLVLAQFQPGADAGLKRGR